MSSDEGYKLLPDSLNYIDDDPPDTTFPFLFQQFALLRLGALRQISPLISSQLLYSPAQDAIAYETRPFSVKIEGTMAIYFGEPSGEVDQAWKELYGDFDLSQLSEDEVVRLPNKTAPYSGDPTKHVVILTVFHQLHCVNVLRKVFRSDYYADPVTGDIGSMLHADIPLHVTHCLDFLRQGAMCAADLSPIPFIWDDEVQDAIPNPDIVHTCRKWENVVDWARAHKM
ncbi:hypothetical protein NM688_g2070 [Phlebia brevispora]|uniref:Uncharacterized protein n=1 Tax=Phlebia brevispora TaxID=194682 RepID=A0ACC1TA12_9APHY|nr:hypothetical protein NM688_g2070 [Phlebia brevispora]